VSTQFRPLSDQVDNWSQMDAALSDSAAYSHPVDRVKRLETDVSVIYLAGGFVYKLKKPVAFGPRDFRLLETRRRMCEEEVRLNRRLAHGIYLGVMEVRFDGSAYAIGGLGKIVDYVVKMVRFDETRLFSSLLAEDKLDLPLVEHATVRLASFHCHTSIAPHESNFGTAAVIREQMDSILQAFDGQLPANWAWAAWFAQTFEALQAYFQKRRQDGYVRECHGDLHLNNIVADRGMALFDCLEFSAELRWIDVISDIAFLVMDYLAHGRRDLAFRTLNRWLEGTGDYSGLAALPFYIGYRALLRAWALGLRNAQVHKSAEDSVVAAYWHVVQTAADPARPALLLCHGFSGSCKSLASDALAMQIGAVRLCADLEHKRAHPLEPVVFERQPQHGSRVESIDGDYRHVLNLASSILGAGFTTIVDAAFLQRRHRKMFIELARQLGIPIFILDFDTPDQLANNRLETSAKAQEIHLSPVDARAEILQSQIQHADPLCGEEQSMTLTFSCTDAAHLCSAGECWAPLTHALAVRGIRGALG